MKFVVQILIQFLRQAQDKHLQFAFSLRSQPTSAYFAEVAAKAELRRSRLFHFAISLVTILIRAEPCPKPVEERDIGPYIHSEKPIDLFL